MLAVLYSGEIGTADSATPQEPYTQGSDAALPNGVIGVSLQIGAARIGDPAVLYAGMVHPQGPAHQAGLAHETRL
ncbi:MAG: hypothetical protein ABI945_04400 [Nitrospirales bacterium]